MASCMLMFSLLLVFTCGCINATSAKTKPAVKVGLNATAPKNGSIQYKKGGRQAGNLWGTDDDHRPPWELPPEPHALPTTAKPPPQFQYDSFNKSRCGASWYYAQCHSHSDTPCCSSWGECVGDNFHCDQANGCQIKYGKCGQEQKCGKDVNGRCHGRFLDACCRDTNCGTDPYFCNQGCDPHWGSCDQNFLISEDKCGPDNGGNTCQRSKVGPCCSIWGNCGATEEHCDFFNCLTRYGKCGHAYRCGKWVGGYPCHGNYTNQCCSKDDYCGTTPDHCGDGCQKEYGQCTGVGEGTCGPKNFGRTCAESRGPCCSKIGYCGETADHCLPERGCQIEYGKCGMYWDCGPKFNGMCHGLGRGENMCCNVDGKCGDTEEFCGIKCDHLYGPCDERKEVHDGRCGHAFDGANCVGDSKGPCCNSTGHCGFSEKHCTTFHGCQIKYGKCGTARQCGAKVNGNCTGAFEGQCCSKSGFCGTTFDYCGTDCQEEHGTCWIIPDRQCIKLTKRCEFDTGLPCCGAREGEYIKCRYPEDQGIYEPYCLPFRYVPLPWTRSDWPQNRPVRWPTDCKPNVPCFGGRSVHAANLIETPDVVEWARGMRNDPREIDHTERAFKIARKEGLLAAILDEDYSATANL